MPRFSRCRVVFLLVLLFLPMALQAAEPRRHAEPVRNGSSTFSWAVLAQVWSFLTGAQSDNGCEFDPNGRCRFAPAMVDNGCEVDPDGRCRG